MTRICLIGDYDAGVVAHQVIPKALALAADGAKLQAEWLDTESAQDASLDSYDGFWCVPASPYRSMEGALRVIRFARENHRPFLGDVRRMPARRRGIRSQRTEYLPRWPH
jgi:CTP synthase (UTP-ammonia lyase)